MCNDFLLTSKERNCFDFPGVIIEVEFSELAFSDSLFFKFNIVMPVSLKSAVRKRKAEYLAGRIAAKMALAKFKLENINILSDSRRCPLWPKGLVGSISHNKTHAMCALVMQEQVSNVGIDIESIIKPNSKSIDALERFVIDTNEQDIIKSSDMNYTQALTTVFSAKESIFKAFYPNVKMYFDFTAVKLLSIPTSGAYYEFKISETLALGLEAGKLIRVLVDQHDDDVVTLVSC